ncbi:aldo/keto reductase [Paracoccus aerodenitrificans]|uniref:aldo/keto reductase n=1 Tax=Paracoccus aerodenitrificans TaxID=3017781 RepID=UPI0022F04687|nr:aldo/keto reductase [Paracoccus aerodenitrificans]WBU64266.1 aldo/keto reductase [Paracoccus aerodenitrificans]
MNPVETVRIGNREVRRIGFGAMRLSTKPEDRRQSIAVAQLALECVDLIDTAFMYGWGANEELLAEALRPYPERLLLATKIGIVQPRPGDWAVCGRPDVLKEQTDAALRRLQVDTIDLLQLHRIDPEVPLADQVGQLGELMQQGKVRSVGLSEITREQLVEASKNVEIASVQNRYSVFDRAAEPVLLECEARGIAFLPWQPISPKEGDATTETVDQIAREKSATRPQIALAWLLHKSPTIAPIPGTANLSHLEENVAAVSIRLDEHEFLRLSAI